MNEKCEWPNCNEDALCSSGNFAGHLVCRKHFEITNGNGEDKIKISWSEITQLVKMCLDDPIKSSNGFNYIVLDECPRDRIYILPSHIKPISFNGRMLKKDIYNKYIKEMAKNTTVIRLKGVT